MRKQGALFALLLAFTLVAEACGDSGTTTTGAPSTEAPATEAPATTAPPATELFGQAPPCREAVVLRATASSI